MARITKISKRGFVTEIRNSNGKIAKEVKVNGEIFRRNTLFKTYNSVKNNELLHKSQRGNIIEVD